MLLAMLPAMPIVSIPVVGHFGWGMCEQWRLVGRIEAMRSAGEPMWPEDFANRDLPDAQNAAADLLAAEKFAHMDGRDGAWLSDLDPGRKLTPGEIVRLETLLKARQESLDRAKAAAGQNDAEWGIQIKSPVMMTLLPSLNKQRMLAHLLRAAAIAAHARGHDDEAIQWALVMQKQARFTSMQPALISHLVGLGIATMNADMLERWLPTLRIGADTGMARPDQIKALIVELMNDQAWSDNWRRAMQFERLSEIDGCFLFVDGTLDINGQALNAKPNIAAELAGQILAPLAYADTRWMIAATSQVMEVGSKTNYPAAIAALPLEETSEGKPSDWWHPLSRLIAPTMDRAVLTDFRARTTRHLLATGLALRWYAIDHQDQMPEKLEELAPKYLAAAPIDPFDKSDAPLHYKSPSLLYSIGEDGANNGGDGSGVRWKSKDVVMKVK